MHLTIGATLLADFTLEDAERAMASLSREITTATRRQYAQLISKVLRLAVYPCKLMDRSPLPLGFLPTVKVQKATALLYPSEDALLLACTTIPLARRMLYGFLAREGLRLGEALRLRWKDVDLVRGVVRLDENKTDDARAWALSPGTAAALEAFRKRQRATEPEPDEAGETEAVDPDEATIFQERNPDSLADRFRVDLAEAKVTRAELFETSKSRRPIRVHDLRATFVTLALAGGRTEAWVADRTGHRSSVMSNRYRRQARHAAELNLGALAELVLALPEFAEAARAALQTEPGGPEGGPTQEPASSGRGDDEIEPSCCLCRRWESNPHSC